MIKLDYTIESPEERKELVEKIIAENNNLTPSYLEILADYLVTAVDKQEKQRTILTKNRMATVNKRECSFEGLVSQLENGEDGIYNLMTEDKNTIFRPKISITQRDLNTIPSLKQLRETINAWSDAAKKTSGKEAYMMKKALIEMRKDQYLIKQGYQKPIVPNKLTRGLGSFVSLEDNSYMDENREVVVQGVSFMDNRVVTTILCNYSKLKQDSWSHFEGDTWYLMESFDDLCTIALKDYPLYERIVECKIDGLQNVEIQLILEKEFGIKHSLEYISSLWRNKIPKLIAQSAQEEFIIHEYKRHKWPMKKCSRCGQWKPTHNDFFSKNKTSKDGFYSICKSCRNKKKG